MMTDKPGPEMNGVGGMKWDSLFKLIMALFMVCAIPWSVFVTTTCLSYLNAKESAAVLVTRAEAKIAHLEMENKMLTSIMASEERTVTQIKEVRDRVAMLPPVEWREIIKKNTDAIRKLEIEQARRDTP